MVSEKQIYRFQKLSLLVKSLLSSIRAMMNKTDGLILIGFALFAIFLNLTVWGGRTPYVFLDGDGANIASFCAALDHPGLFQGDELLENQGNYRFYMSIHIPLIRGLYRLTGQYGTAYLLLLAPHIFLQALGFYLLGRVVFHNRFWALLFAIVTLPTFWLNIAGEFWGVNPTPIPRITFQALLPFLLTATFQWRHETRNWPWVMAGAGALMYVHPVSAPAWAFALWLGFWIFLPRDWPWGKRLSMMFFYGAIFLLISSPFLLNYLGNHDHGVATNTQEIYTIINHRFTPEYLDAWLAFTGFLNFILNIKPQTLLLLLVASPVIIFELNKEGRRELALLALWLLGLVFISVIVSGVEQSVAHFRQATPVQIDLVRNLRYILPILLLLVIWALAEMSRRLKTSVGIALLSILVVSLYVSSYGFHADLNTFIPALRQGTPFMPLPEDQEIIHALDAVREKTPEGAKILPTALGVQIRFYALRPVVYAWKDGGALAYSNHADLVDWYQKDLAFQKAIEGYGKNSRLEGLSALSVTLNADYLLVDFEVKPKNIVGLPLTTVYIGKNYSLLKVEK